MSRQLDHTQNTVASFGIPHCLLILSNSRKFKKILRVFCFFKLKWQVAKQLTTSVVIFIRDIVHYRIRYDVLLSVLNFYFPARALPETFNFRLPKLKSNFAFNNPIFPCISITNKIINLIDTFSNVSPETFKKNTVIVLDQFHRK